MASEIKVDTVSEKTSGSGVTIDGLLIKDGGISGDVSLIGTTPTFTIGDAGAEDAALVFDGNAQDFYIALDDSADDLLIGLGSTVGTTPAISIDENLAIKTYGDITMTGTTPTLTIGDAGAEDTAIVFDGNAQDFHIGLDDSSDDLVIGVGSSLGTTTALAIDENAGSTFSGTVTVGVDDTGKDVKFFGATASRYWLWDESADGVVQRGTLTVGVDDTGHDVKFFGASAGAYMEWDESADELRLMGASADATTSTGKLLLATSLTNINANDVLGKIDFQAPHEAGGTDAITVAASIRAVAQSTFSASSNATDLIFYTGHSEAAAEKVRITSQNEIGIAGANYGSDGQVLTSGGAGAAVAWEDAAGTTINNNADNRVITGSGTAGTLNGEANLTFDGTTLVTAGQVSFPASQSASADANTLDDYEEGSWTPAGNNITFASSDGKYTKIGDTVFAWGEAVWPSTGDTNGARMTGLPFAVNAAVPGFGGGFWGMGENDTHTGATEGQSYISFRNPQADDSGAGGNEKPNNVFSTDTMKVGVCYKV